MFDHQPSKLSVDLSFSSVNWSPRRLRAVSGRLCQVTDITVLSGVFLGMTILPVFRQNHNTLTGLLQSRISLRNVLLGVMCLGTWRIILMSVGIYTPERTRSLLDYIFRCIIGLNSCAAVVWLVEVLLQSRMDAWHMVELYWMACLLLMTSARVVLLLLDLRRSRRLAVR